MPIHIVHGAVDDYLCESIVDFSFYITVGLVGSTDTEEDILNNASGSIANFASVARLSGAGHLVRVFS